MRIIEGWKQLLDILMTKEVFLDHLKMLKQGFVASTTDLELSGLEKSSVRHVETLVRLLVHTAEHVDRDDSTECRFATLLEILLSYTPNWEASDEVARLWIRLMQRIPYQCAPTNFRRKAYRVLVSLSWVPSSKGLLAACSLPERELRVTPLPKASQTYRSATGRSTSNNSSGSGSNKENNNNADESQPDAPIIIPRHDSVNQLLDRLKDETDVCVAITSTEPGIGKSTLASLVVSHPSIQKSFFVVWIRLVHGSRSSSGSITNNSKSHNMTFESYRDYIIQTRDQIREQQQRLADKEEETISFTFPTCEERFEEPAVRRLREEQAMQETKERVAKELQSLHNPNLLLVLETSRAMLKFPCSAFMGSNP